MTMDIPNAMEAAACLQFMTDGRTKLLAANGVARVEVEGGSGWMERTGYRLRRWLRRPARRQTIVWHLMYPLKPLEAVALVLASPSDIEAVAVMGPGPGQVTTVTEAGAWPSRIELVVMRCPPFYSEVGR